MQFDVMVAAPLAVQIHVAAALAALCLGPIAIWRRRRDALHKWSGRIWVIAMAVLAGSSFLISEARQFGPFSLIHILSVITFVGLWQGLAAIRRGDVMRHQRAMRALYMQALILAGVFTFLPGRRMNAMISGEFPWLGFAFAAALGAGVLWLVWREGRLLTRPIAASAHLP